MKLRLNEIYPSAWIVKNNRTDKTKNDRGRIKIYTGNKVYLNDNSEFEIELFNPTKKSVLAKIKINGAKISESGLVLRPGERVYLDCFFDSKRKFVFKTYEVDNTKELKKVIQKAIEDNGIVEVSFFDEKEENVISEPEMYIPKNIDWTYIDNYNFQGFNQNGSIPSTNFFPTTGTKIYTQQGTGGYSTINNTNSGTCGYSTISGSTFTCMSGNTTNTTTFANLNSLETGRVEKGDISNQNFTKVDMEFDKLLNKVTYKIFPEKTKAIKSEDLKPKNYCTNCGRKNTDVNYCPSCGTKLK